MSIHKLYLCLILTNKMERRQNTPYLHRYSVVPRMQRCSPGHLHIFSQPRECRQHYP
uniref:Uncharacterized protein n=1 Tax=Romanomermis culicivorax TaxID=13658 RepID=A0A915L5S7_ROMCU